MNIIHINRKQERMVTINCKQIEELILKQKTDIITQDEIKQIESHIANCSSCKTFYLTVSKIEANMEFDSNAYLQPNPTIRENVIKNLKDRSIFKKQRYLNLIDFVRSILDYRIPVYQAGLAVLIIIFLVTYGFDFSKSLIDKNSTKSPTSQKVEYPVSDEYMIETYPDLNNQKVGINVREDSILIEFIYTSM